MADRFDDVAEQLTRRYGEIASGVLAQEIRAVRQFGAGPHLYAQRYESPIEELFAMGLIFCLQCDRATRTSEPFFQIGIAKGFEQIRDKQTGKLGVEVWSQVPVGAYRADFLLRICMDEAVGPVWAAVECDGHDFHEKTKEQAASDKARDNHFQSLNIAVLRYTGSVIWRDPAGAAADALKRLEMIALRRVLAAGRLDSDEEVMMLLTRWEGGG